MGYIGRKMFLTLSRVKFDGVRNISPFLSNNVIFTVNKLFFLSFGTLKKSFRASFLASDSLMVLDRVYQYFANQGYNCVGNELFHLLGRFTRRFTDTKCGQPVHTNIF